MLFPATLTSCKFFAILVIVIGEGVIKEEIYNTHNTHCMSSTFADNLAHMGVCSGATMGSYYTTDTQNTCHSCVAVTYLALWVCVAIIILRSL